MSTHEAPVTDGQGGTPFNNRQDLQESLNRLVSEVRKEIVVEGQSVPKYGTLTLLAQDTPCYVYTHPAIAGICDTAFTDGLHVFFYGPFLEALIQSEEQAPNPHRLDQVPLLLHELNHKLLSHTQRMVGWPNEVRAYAQDAAINSRLVKTIEALHCTCGPMFNQGCGMETREMIDRYSKMSEEQIGYEIIRDAKKRQQQQGKGAPQQQGNSGQSGAGQQQPGKGQGKNQNQKTGAPQSGSQSHDPNGSPDQGDQDQSTQQPGQKGQKDQRGGKNAQGSQPSSDAANQGKGSQGQPSQGHGHGQKGSESGHGHQHGHQHGGGYGQAGDIHTVSLDDFIKVLEENEDLTYAKKLLNLPDSANTKEIKEKLQNELGKIIDKVQAANQMRKHLGDRYPGAHIDSYASEVVDKLTAAKLKWKSAIRDAMYGYGHRFHHNDDVPHHIYYVNPADMNMDSEVYLGTSIPSMPSNVVVVIVDTSGSCDPDLLHEFFSEVAGILRDREFSEALVYCADTTTRGEPLKLTPHNVERVMQEVQAHGRGGTDFAEPLRSVWESKEVKAVRERVTTILYFTDLGCPPTSRAELPAKIAPICYVTTPGLMDKNFANAVKDHARVVEIDVGKVVDLDMLESDIRKGQDNKAGPARRSRQSPGP